MAAATMASMPTSNVMMPSACACPSCGLTLELPPLPEAHVALLQAQRQITELQAQVRALDQKAAAAIDRWADYESEIARLRRASNSNSNGSTGAAAPASKQTRLSNAPASASPRSSFPGASRISQLLSSRSSNSSNNSTATNQPVAGSTAQHNASSSLSSSTGQTRHESSPANAGPSAAPAGIPTTTATDDTDTPPPPPPKPPMGPSTDDLIRELSREKKLRRAAEARVDDTSKEVEELSVSLFEQANEMVATERRARAKLEERVSVLEQRDVEKRVRLERLEGAMARLDRVRALLGDSGGDGDKEEEEEKEKEDGNEDDKPESGLQKDSRNGENRRDVDGGKHVDHDVA